MTGNMPAGTPHRARVLREAHVQRRREADKALVKEYNDKVREVEYDIQVAWGKYERALAEHEADPCTANRWMIVLDLYGEASEAVDREKLEIWKKEWWKKVDKVTKELADKDIQDWENAFPHLKPKPKPKPTNNKRKLVLEGPGEIVTEDSEGWYKMPDHGEACFEDQWLFIE